MSQAVNAFIVFSVVGILGAVILLTVVKLCCCSIPSAVSSQIEESRRKKRRRQTDDVEGQNVSSTDKLLSVISIDRTEPSAPTYTDDDYQEEEKFHVETERDSRRWWRANRYTAQDEVDHSVPPPAYTKFATTREGCKNNYYLTTQSYKGDDQPPSYSSLQGRSREIAQVHTFMPGKMTWRLWCKQTIIILFLQRNISKLYQYMGFWYKA